MRLFIDFMLERIRTLNLQCAVDAVAPNGASAA